MHKTRCLMRCGLVAMFILTLFPLLAEAQANDTRTESFKIRVVDRKRVFDEYQRQKDEFKRLEEEVTSMQKDIDVLSEKIKSAQERYEREKDRLDTDARETLRQQINSDMLRYRADFERMQSEVDLRYANLMQRIKNEIDEVVAEVAEEENCHLVLEGDPKSPSGVLYYATPIDMTQRVIERLNNRPVSRSGRN